MITKYIVKWIVMCMLFGNTDEDGTVRGKYSVNRFEHSFKTEKSAWSFFDDLQKAKRLNKGNCKYDSIYFVKHTEY